jgi:flagellar assembly factor FliW
MLIKTSRFGAMEIEADDILLFPQGLLGFEECRHWVLLADADNDAVGWLQNISRSELALAVVSPRRFVPGYEVRVPRGQLAPLQLNEIDQAYVLTVVSKNEGSLTINLKAPLVINLDRRIGRQIVSCDDQPMQHRLSELPLSALPLRKSA